MSLSAPPPLPLTSIAGEMPSEQTVSGSGHRLRITVLRSR